MKKLLSFSLMITMFCMLSSTALAADCSYWTSQAKWQFCCQPCQNICPDSTQNGNQNGSQIGSYDWWQSLLEQIYGNQTDSTPDTTPEATPDTTPETTPDDTTDNTTDTPDTTPDDVVVPDNNGSGTENNGSTGSTGSNTTQSSNAYYAEQVVTLVNQERAAEGLSPVTMDDDVAAAALVRARECATSFSHTRPNGTSCFTALKETGVSYRGAGENIAYGQQTPTEVMQAWMNSSGHRANILNGDYTKIGVAYTVINGTPYWAQFFIY